MSNLLLFANFRNERHNVAWFFDHYRKIGVDHFHIVDNGSQDGTKEFLADQPDVTLHLKTEESFKSANFGLEWLNNLRTIYGRDKWCLFVDADEMLMYPGFPDVSLKKITSRMERLGQRCLIGFMLDMFNNNNILCPWPKNCQDPINTYSSYDPTSIRIRPTKNFPFIGFFRGVRQEILRELIDTSNSGHVINLRKIPLIFSETGDEYKTVHTCEYLSPSDLTCVLLHFKINGNLESIANAESKREQHFNDGAEYKLYLNAINAGKFQFNKECEKWSNINKLIQDGLISVTDEWLRYLEKQGATFEANPIENEKKFQTLALWPSVAHVIGDQF